MESIEAETEFDEYIQISKYISHKQLFGYSFKQNLFVQINKYIHISVGLQILKLPKHQKSFKIIRELVLSGH